MLLGMKSWSMLIAIVFFAVAQVYAQTPQQPLVGKVLDGEYSTAKALQLVYGNYDAAKKVSTWGVPGETVEGQLTVGVLNDTTYVDNGVPKHLLATWASDGDTCRACGGVIGMISFVKDGTGWKIVAGNRGFDDAFGVWGQPPQKVTVKRLGPHIWGVILEESYFREDVFGENIWIYGADESGLKKWLDIQQDVRSATGKFPNTWCAVRRKAEKDLTCIFDRFDFALGARRNGGVYDLIRTERSKSGVSHKHWAFDGNGYVSAGD